MCVGGQDPCVGSVHMFDTCVEVRVINLGISPRYFPLFVWDMLFHWSGTSPSRPGCQAYKLPGSSLSLSSILLCWDYRHIPVCPAFYVGSGDLNSDPHT